jgi:hypothetical protein
MGFLGHPMRVRHESEYRVMDDSLRVLWVRFVEMSLRVHERGIGGSK